MEPAWDSPELAVVSDSTRTARYRLLQSWYRENVLNVPPGKHPMRPRLLGSMLCEEEVAERPDLNFLDPEIAAYAADRAEVVQAENGTLEVKRLFHNMLSSMPLCFNVFGMVREAPEAQLPFVRTLFDPEATAVELIECEWTPRQATIGDRTAFDAAIITHRADGSAHLTAIETKYTEPFSPKEYDSARYREVHDQCGWFEPGTADALTGRATNQLWRNCLLAAAAELAGEVDSASVAVVALEADEGVGKAVARVQAAMVDERRCVAAPLELIVDAGRAIDGLNDWSKTIERRYLELTPVQT